MRGCGSAAAAAVLCAIGIGADIPDATVDGIAAVKSWSQRRLRDAEASFAGSRMQSPEDWAHEVVYQIVVDRFNNGNLTNDALNVLPSQRSHSGTSDPQGLPNWRHGGDIAGISARVPYLQQLGITTVWLTPLLKHNGEYHGYCTVDHTEVDPGFGTAQELKDLVQRLHGAGMRVVLDIVVNHLCDLNTSYAAPISPADHAQCCADRNELYWGGRSGEPASAGALSFGSSFFPALRSPHFFNRCGADTSSEMQGEGPPAVFGDFTAGMFDYDTRNYDFQDIFFDLHAYWVAALDLDGLRLDAAKHVTMDFVADFSTRMRNYTAGLNKRNFFVIGEVAASASWQALSLGRMLSSPSDPDQRDESQVPPSLTAKLWQRKDTYLAHRAFPLPGLNAVYNFQGSGTARSALLQQSPSSNVAKYFDSQDYRTVQAQTLSQNTGLLECWNLLEIHDWPRFLASAPNRTDLLVSGLGYLFTSPGAPIVYYGLEQGFNGNCGPLQPSCGTATTSVAATCASNDDSLKRQDMFASGPWRLESSVADVDVLQGIGPTRHALSPDWRQDKFLQPGPVFEVARALSALRRSCEPLATGSMTWRDASDAIGGFLAFSRIGLGGQEIVVIVNPGGDSERGWLSLDKLAIGDSVSGRRYVNALNPQQVATTDMDGSAPVLAFAQNFSIPAGTTAVFIHEQDLDIDAEPSAAASASSGAPLTCRSPTPV